MAAYAITLADDAEFDLRGVDPGIYVVRYGPNAAMFNAVASEDATAIVTGASSTNFASSDTDTKMCFFYDETTSTLKLKNRTGSETEVEISRIV